VIKYIALVWVLLVLAACGNSKVVESTPTIEPTAQASAEPTKIIITYRIADLANEPIWDDDGCGLLITKGYGLRFTVRGEKGDIDLLFRVDEIDLESFRIVTNLGEMKIGQFVVADLADHHYAVFQYGGIVESRQGVVMYPAKAFWGSCAFDPPDPQAKAWYKVTEPFFLQKKDQEKDIPGLR
jgi:hypothetical protein